jgi:hypothetical protein
VYRRAHQASTTARECRRHLRVRAHLVRQRTATINLLRADGVRLPTGSAESVLDRLGRLTLPSTLQMAITPLHDILAQLTQTIATADAALRARAAAEPATRQLMTAPNPRFLIHDAENPASPLCQRCHAVDNVSHMDATLNARMKGAITRCTDCHMPGTAIVGGIAGDFGRLIKPPPYSNATEEEHNAYWEGPINSHVFDMPMKTNVAVRGVPPGRAMPIPYTSSCGTCHVVNELPFR